MQENEVLVALIYEIDVPCVVQWRLLHDSIKDVSTVAQKIAKYHDVIHMAIGTTFTLSFGGQHTPRTCQLRSVAVVLYRSPDRD